MLERASTSAEWTAAPRVSSTNARPQAARSRWIAGLSWGYLGLVMVVSFLLLSVSENWWFSSAMTYAPRIPYLAPAAILLVLSALWHRGSIAVNLISLAIVAVPVMGLTLPVAAWTAPSPSAGPTLKLVSCNVQDYRPNFAGILEEVARFNPDVVVFQDARSESKLLEAFFAKWHHIHDGEFFAASRFPLKLVAIGHFEPFDRDGVLQCELDVDGRKVMLFNVHQMTPRHGLRALDVTSPVTQRGSAQMSRYLALRADEAAQLRDFVEGSRGDAPTLLAGDFNMPCESSLYQHNWFGYQNAFNTAGTGYGYSFPCTRQYCWPAGIPWMRLDHILADEAWIVRDCFIGSVNGSDHRLIAATLELVQPSAASDH